MYGQSAWLCFLLPTKWPSWFSNVPVIKHHVIFPHFVFKMSPLEIYSSKSYMVFQCQEFPLERWWNNYLLFLASHLTVICEWQPGRLFQNCSALGPWAASEGFVFLIDKKKCEVKSPLVTWSIYHTFLKHIQFQRFCPFVLISTFIPFRPRVQKSISVYFQDYSWSKFLWFC